MISIQIFSHLWFLKTDLLLPAFSEHLVFDVGLEVEGFVLYFLVDMSGSIMANHVYVESVISVLVPESAFGEVLLVNGFMVIEPIAGAVVCWYCFAFSEVKE